MNVCREEIKWFLFLLETCQNSEIFTWPWLAPWKDCLAAHLLSSSLKSNRVWYTGRRQGLGCLLTQIRACLTDRCSQLLSSGPQLFQSRRWLWQLPIFCHLPSSTLDQLEGMQCFKDLAPFRAAEYVLHDQKRTAAGAGPGSINPYSSKQCYVIGQQLGPPTPFCDPASNLAHLSRIY